MQIKMKMENFVFYYYKVLVITSFFGLDIFNPFPSFLTSFDNGLDGKL